MLRRLIFAIPFLVIFAQALFMDAGYGEPYPALMMPAFRGTLTESDGSIATTSIDIAVRFDDGSAEHMPLRTLLAPMPRMTMGEAAEHVFRGPAPATPSTVRWLRGRLATAYPDRHPSRVDVRWYRDRYRVDDGTLSRVAHVLTVTYGIDLTR